ncbi:MAG: hypothetical protein CMN30_17750 [Sandaracinus sp.]|nr:hypothetical protein [Sandaracinus sp.]|tara:strand:+ start:412 stop:1143 length:732 start_codon:yes stop_codon:yes gene_type:complete
MRILFASLLGLTAPAAVFACSYAGQNDVMGVFGYGNFGGDERVPANVASRQPYFRGGTAEAFTTPAGEFFRVPTDVDPVQVASGAYLPRGEAPDLTPPARPVVEGATFTVSGGSGSCAEKVAFYDLQVRASDDFAPPERLTYAVSITETPTDSGLPDDFVAPDGVDADVADLFLWGAVAEEGQDRWVWVRTIDQAGNVSEVSEPYFVDTGDAASGCSASGRLPRGLALPLAAMALLGFTRRRR